MKGLRIITALAALTFAVCAFGQEPKSEEAKVRKARKEDHTVRQVTPDPKKSPAKHADNLSKNVNHELNRNSKHINRMFQGKKHKKKTTTTSNSHTNTGKK